MDFSHLSQQEQAHLQMVVEQNQIKESMRIYNTIVDRCFTDCIKDMTSSALSPKENTCVKNCVNKFLKHSERVGQRFTESQVLMQQKQMEEGMAS
ncbi:hypothetical protein AMAG_14931 [Allomyces macrogynus ATCC 38327]|uniref:Mitochondrial import inner membrane translocase subunit n=1 Tax=Allomyces macrogynus (strain ATCC 38327) TaxID=578462 RepID=A0A0L0T7Z2_ALLM3|nr:hypothetical protein AMAG_14931 [Allomyces macrogynus ATCC 38327]|eukprot:KNE70816.1 hypothetical protein AMAG_14931 [Allomyces macrogynus ATCC 38327]